jgi:hypothetical protein
MPDQFWSLTLREFWLKFDGFARAEDRRRGLIFEHALMVGRGDQKQQRQLQRGVNALRRYPLKRWLLPRPEA